MVVAVPVIKAFDHDGVAWHVGQTISVEPIVAASLAQRGVVSLTRGYQTAAIEPEKPKRRRRAYRRRDMVAE